MGKPDCYRLIPHPNYHVELFCEVWRLQTTRLEASNGVNGGFKRSEYRLLAKQAESLFFYVYEVLMTDDGYKYKNIRVPRIRAQYARGLRNLCHNYHLYNPPGYHRQSGGLEY